MLYVHKICNVHFEIRSYEFLCACCTHELAVFRILIFFLLMLPCSADAFLTLVGSFGAFANGAGRLFFGFCIDHAKEKTVLFIMFFLQIGFCIVYPYCVDGKAEFTIVVLVLHFLYGGNFAVFPALVWKQFGKTYFGSIYSVILAAWGIGGIGGDTLVNVIEKPLGQLWLFVTLAIISLVSCVLALFLNAEPDDAKRWRSLFGRKSSNDYAPLVEESDKQVQQHGMA